jgi:D-alanine-D-alanine ligase
VKVGIVYSKTRMEDLEEEIYENKRMKGKTLDAVKEALYKENDVLLLNEDVLDLNSLKTVDIVFNLSTGLRGESKQSHIPAVLERLGIPYTGSGVLSHAVGLNKPVSKEIFVANNIPTPEFLTVRTSEIQLDHLLKYPLIVKPTNGGSSRGIIKVESASGVGPALATTLDAYGKALVEEFIEGKEITVGILGNERLKVLPILETDFEGCEASLYNFDIKAEIGYTQDNTFAANLTEMQEQRVHEVATGAYRAIGCRDYARVDIRLHNDTPYVLEINTLPGLYLDYSAIPAMAKIEELSFDTLIRKIFYYAVLRCNLGKNF